MTQCKSEYSNWVIPDILLCGPYPFTDGINFLTAEEGMKNINDILEDGIDTFVCLCDELPSTSEHDGKIVKHPYFPKYLHYPDYIKNEKILFRYFPIKDGHIPCTTKMIEYLNFLINDIQNGRKLYIHCAGGHGRTNIFTSILFSLYYKKTPKESIEYVFRMRNTRKKIDKKLIIYNVNPTDIERVFHPVQKQMVYKMIYYFTVIFELEYEKTLTTG